MANDTGDLPQDGLLAFSEAFRRYMRGMVTFHPPEQNEKLFANKKDWSRRFAVLWGYMDTASVYELFSAMSDVLIGIHTFQVDEWRTTFTENWKLLSDFERSIVMNTFMDLLNERRATLDTLFGDDATPRTIR